MRDRARCERNSKRYLSQLLFGTLAFSIAACNAGVVEDDEQGHAEAALSGSPAFSDGFESFAAATDWTDGSVHGGWTVVYNGYGSVGVEQVTSTSKQLHLRPKPPSSAGETHSALVRSNTIFGDEDLSLRIKTVAQLRSTPNKWEVGWLLWHYQDSVHFYYAVLKPSGWELGKADPAYPGAQRFLATGSSPTFSPGSSYRVRVEQIGARITLWVDGQKLTTFTDLESPYLVGAVGLYSEDAHVHFDDVAVVLPSTSSLDLAPPSADLAPPSADLARPAADLAQPAPVPDLASTPSPGGLPDPLYGVTVDDVSNLPAITAALSHLAHRATTRVVFDEFVAASTYLSAVQALAPVSYIMGEILDSYYVKQYTTAAYLARVDEYLAVLGDKVDLWEVGNEINGEWLGDTATVVSKVTGAYDKVKAAGKRTELTLYYNKNCWASADHEMFAWTAANIPDRMKQGLDYVLVSYYEDDCNGLQPDWNAVFNRLALMFPNSKIGIGECGTLDAAKKASYVERYYNLQVTAPRYVGGYFWWYFREDMVPYTQALWSVLNLAIQ